MMAWVVRGERRVNFLEEVKMRESLIRASQSEKRIVEYTEYMEEHYIIQIQELWDRLCQKDMDGVVDITLFLLTRMIEHVFNCKRVKKCEKLLKRNLQQSTISSEKNVPNSICNDIEYKDYCDAILRIAFNSIASGYIGGISYRNLVETILKKACISTSEENVKKLCDSFKKHISKTVIKTEEIEKVIRSTRINHKGVADKNQNGGNLFYGAIMPYERAAYEFEFFFRNRNQSKGMDDLLTQLEQETIRRFQSILPEDKIENLELMQKKYTKLCRISKAGMSEDEITDYLGFINLKYRFIKEYADQEFVTLELLEQERALSIPLFGVSVFLDITINELSNLGYALVMIINRKFEGIKDEPVEDNRKNLEFFWKAMLRLFNGVDSVLSNQMKTLVFQNLEKMNKEPIRYKNIWKNVPSLSVGICEKRMQEHLVENLVSNDKGRRDFIELCFLIQYKSREDAEYDCLESAFQFIFTFMSACVKAAETAGQQGIESINIKNEILELKQNLVRINITLDTDEFIYNYPYIKCRRYFSDCFATRYVRMYKLMEKYLDKEEINNQLSTDKIVRLYISSILSGDADKNLYLPSAYIISELSSLLTAKILNCLFPNIISNPDEFDIYPIKESVLKIAGKYNFRDELGL